MAKAFKFLGKDRKFKRVKMVELMELQENMQEEMRKETDPIKAILAAGKMVENFLTPFNAEELLEAEPEDFWLVQGLHMIHAYVKLGKSKEEVDNLKQRIIDKAIDNQLMNYSVAQQFQA